MKKQRKKKKKAIVRDLTCCIHSQVFFTLHFSEEGIELGVWFEID